MPELSQSGLPLGTEAQFAEDVKTLIPILERMSEAMRANRNILAGQKFQMEANQQILNRQNADIAKNKEVVDANKLKADELIKTAEERAKLIERGITERVAVANHKEREAIKKLDEAEKILWRTREENKRIVAVKGDR